MGPSKASNSNAKAQSGEDQKPESTPISTIQPVAATVTDNVSMSEGDAGSRKDTTAQRPNTWYGGGTLRRGSKAIPVTQVAKESILAATDKASELVTTARGSTANGTKHHTASPSMYLSRSLRKSNRALPVAASTTKVDAIADSPQSPPGDSQQSATISTAPDVSSTKRRGLNEKQNPTPTPKPDPPDDTTSRKLKGEGSKASTEILPWRGWFSRNEEPPKPEPLKIPNDTVQSADIEPEHPVHRRSSDPSAMESLIDQSTPPRSWLGSWAATRPAKAGSADGAICTAAPSLSHPPSSSEPAAPGPQHAPGAQDSQSTPANKSPGWAFWSRGPSGNTVNDAKQFKQGELVIAAPRSEASPESPMSDVSKTVSGKRPCSVDSVPKARISQSQQAQTETFLDPTKKQKTNAQSEPPQANYTNNSKNLLLPPITGTYRSAPRLSLLESLSRWWQEDRSSRTNRVQLLQNPPRIKKALAIGVHGYFPAPLIRSVLGQPTGTSVRFADGAANAIHSWTSARGYQCEIEKVALEGEGKILERVDLLWKLLLSWIDNIRRADFVMVACHSQGVPVAIMLIARLIEFRCVHGARIGVCAMAGVNLGPFIDFKSRWIGGSAGELFEFARSDSQVSTNYHAALQTTLNFGARIAYIGSIDDQLVSLESSTFGTVDHPHLYRAVFVDGRIHAPDFLTHLVGFALKLRNLGVSDHGLIRELSSPLAGSLYGGEGHSRIYEDDAVYCLAVQNALETTAIGEANFEKIREGLPLAQNPYILPFSLRGVLEEDYVRNELREETMELLKQFDEWKPSTKVLKDVKFRLEGIRSKL